MSQQPPDRPTSLTGWLRDLQGDADARVFFDISPDLLTVVNEDGLIHRFNPAWGETLGYTEQELAGRLFMDLVYLDDGTLLDRNRLIGLAESHEKLRLHLRAKDGSSLAVALIAAHEREGLATYVILRVVQALEDVCVACGRILHAEAVASAAQRRLRVIMEQAPIGFVMLNADARIVYANQRLARLLDYQPKSLIGMDVFELMEPEQRARREPLFRRDFARTGEPANHRFVRLRSRLGVPTQVDVIILSLLHDAELGVIVMYLREAL